LVFHLNYIMMHGSTKLKFMFWCLHTTLILWRQSFNSDRPDCLNPGMTRPKQNGRSCHQHRRTDTAHCAVWTSYLCCDFNIVAILCLIIDRYRSINTVYRQTQIVTCLGAFAKLRQVILSFMSVCPFVRPNRTTWLPPDEFLWNLMFEYFYTICPEISSYIKIWQEQPVIYMKTDIQFWSYLVQLFFERKIFHTDIFQKIKTHFMIGIFSPRK
jgi:hypothetical protein